MSTTNSPINNNIHQDNTSDEYCASEDDVPRDEGYSDDSDKDIEPLDEGHSNNSEMDIEPQDEGHSGDSDMDIEPASTKEDSSSEQFICLLIFLTY
jgi:hypothetical protein